MFNLCLGALRHYTKTCADMMTPHETPRFRDRSMAPKREGFVAFIELSSLSKRTLALKDTRGSNRRSKQIAAPDAL